METPSLTLKTLHKTDAAVRSAAERPTSEASFPNGRRSIGISEIVSAFQITAGLEPGLDAAGQVHEVAKAHVAEGLAGKS